MELGWEGVGHHVQCGASAVNRFCFVMFGSHGLSGGTERVEHAAAVLRLGLTHGDGQSGLYHVQAISEALQLVIHIRPTPQGERLPAVVERSPIVPLPYASVYGNDPKRPMPPGC